MTYANDCIRQEKIKIPANNLPDCTIISMSDGSGILESGTMCYFPGRKGRVDLRETSPDKSKDRKCE